MFVAATQPDVALSEADIQLAVFHDVQRMVSRLKGVTDAHDTLLQLTPGCYYLVTSVHANACYSENAGSHSRLRFDGSYVPLFMCVCEPISATGREFVTPMRPICRFCKAIFRIIVPKRFDTSLELEQRVTEQACYIGKFSDWPQHVRDIVGCSDLMINTCLGPMYYSPNELVQIEEEKRLALENENVHAITGFDEKNPLSLDDYVQFYVKEYHQVHPFYRRHFEMKMSDNVLSGVPLVVDTSKKPTVVTTTPSDMCDVDESTTSDTSMSM